MYSLSMEVIIRNRHILLAGMFFFGTIFGLIFLWRFMRTGNFMDATICFAILGGLVYLYLTLDMKELWDHFVTKFDDTTIWMKGVSNEFALKWQLWRSGKTSVGPANWNLPW